jgi:hypothetical protein
MGFQARVNFLGSIGARPGLPFALRGSALALESGFRLRIGVVAQERKNHHTNIRAVVPPMARSSLSKASSSLSSVSSKLFDSIR